jgi:serine/threonine-protein kinase
VGKKIAFVAVPLLLIGAGGAFVAMRPSAPPPPAPVVEVKKEPVAAVTKPTASTVDSEILVQLRSTPSGATIFIDDVQIGTTPTERRLNRAQVHQLTFQLAEHQEVKRKLNFSGVVADSQEVSVTLEPVKAAASEPSRRPSRPQPREKEKEKDDISAFE